MTFDFTLNRESSVSPKDKPGVFTRNSEDGPQVEVVEYLSTDISEEVRKVSIKGVFAGADFSIKYLTNKKGDISESEGLWLGEENRPMLHHDVDTIASLCEEVNKPAVH
jgi:hypothetical protein